MNNKEHPPQPIHVPGTSRGEQMVLDKGKEAGRKDPNHPRTARDSTGINAKHRQPILPVMPNIPPA